eukprot:c26532_g1_i3 orf=333-1850(-)
MSNLQNLHPQDTLRMHSEVLGNSKAANMPAGASANLIFTSDRGDKDYSSECDDGSNDNRDIPGFEFHKGEKGMQRPTRGPFLRPPPSKWDDAEKWLVSLPQSEMNSKVKPKSGHAYIQQGGINSTKTENASNQKDWEKNVHLSRTYHPTDSSKGVSSAAESLLPDTYGLCLDVMRESLSGQTFDFQAQWRHKMDSANCSSDMRDGEIPNFAFRPVLVPPFKPRLDGSVEYHPICDNREEIMTNKADDKEMSLKPMLQTEKPNSDFLTSVSMRDMGTEMTPMASQEPSRTGTPVLATTPTVCSPGSSRASTPRRRVPTCVPIQAFESHGHGDNMGLCELSDKNVQSKARQEILALGAQPGKSSITAWATKEEEDEDASKSLKNLDLTEVKNALFETRAGAWEAVEHAKHMARYKREESRIQAWEIHKMAKAEAEMRRIEVKVERVQSQAHEKMVNKLAAARRRAEERRATAEAKRVEQAEKASKRAECIRQTGRMPSSFFTCGLCH